jgi:hypothetical protein
MPVGSISPHGPLSSDNQLCQASSFMSQIINFIESHKGDYDNFEALGFDLQTFFAPMNFLDFHLKWRFNNTIRRAISNAVNIELFDVV